MSSTKETSRWAREKLHDLLGFSDRNLADYLTSLAGKSPSSADLFEKLVQNDVPRSEATRSFCDELFSRTHSTAAHSSSSSASRGPERQVSNAALVRKSAKYAMVDSDDEDEDEDGDVRAAVEKEKKKAKKKKRDRDEEGSKSKSKSKKKPVASSSSFSSGDRGSESSEEEQTVIRRMGDRAAEESQHALDVEQEEEAVKKAQMDADIAERDAFVNRLLKKESDKTTKSSSSSSSDNNNSSSSSSSSSKAAAGNQIVDGPASESTIDMLREASRQQYLEKREEKELRLLELSLRDDEAMFADSELTEEERQRREVSRQVLAMAKSKYRFDVKDDEYHLPQSYEDSKSGLVDKTKREAALNARMAPEEPAAGGSRGDGDAWEQQLTKKAGLAVRGSGSGSSEHDKQYDLIMEDSIEFLSLEMLKGTRRVEDEEREERERKKAAAAAARVALEQEHLRAMSGINIKGEEGVTAGATTAAAAAASAAAAEESKPLTKHQQILAGRKKLPVYSYREEFLSAVHDHKVLIVVGETGSGKTTQLTQYLHEGGWSQLGAIGCTQPRRVAAMSVAARVATEMDVKLGKEVGYAVRFEDNTCDKTVIKYMTDGMLLREFLTEPDLASYSCMMVDEAHERTLHTDVLFGLVKDIARFRDDFRLIISSATLDADKFSAYFDDAPKFVIPGRMFNVDIMYTKAPEADYLDAAVVTILQIHVTQDLPGDILVFFTGQEEIETCAEILALRTRGLGSRIPELSICPIYANLPSDMQAKIFEPTQPGCRKVVLGTNIAETSLTIDGICYVIDIGFCKQKSYNPKTGMESLMVTPVSRAAANQRAGRAGRTQAGKCFRLFTAWSFHHELDANTTPEIQRTNMGNVVLMLKSLGIDDLLHFDFMDRPPAETLMRALEQLYALGALNDRGELTKMGRRMAEFPLDPMMSKAVIVSEQYACVAEVLTVVSMLSIGSSVFYRPKDKAVHADNAKINFARGGGGDHISLMRVYNEWVQTSYSVQWCFENYLQHRLLNKARDVRDQLVGLCERVEIDAEASTADPETVCKAMTAGYFYNTARIGRNGEYRTTKQMHTVYIHPSSVLTPRIPKPSEGQETKEQEAARREEEERALLNLPKWVMFHELAFTSKEYMRQVCPIQGSWLVEIAPHYYQAADVAEQSKVKMPNQKGKVASAKAA